MTGRHSEKVMVSVQSRVETRFSRYLPFLAWFPISATTVRSDLVAGITVALILVPQSMAYAQLAGMPPVYGLYTALLPVIVGALFGSSHQLATGPVAVVSLLTASALGPIVAPGSAHGNFRRRSLRAEVLSVRFGSWSCEKAAVDLRAV